LGRRDTLPTPLGPVHQVDRAFPRTVPPGSLRPGREGPVFVALADHAPQTPLPGRTPNPHGPRGGRDRRPAGFPRSPRGPCEAPVWARTWPWFPHRPAPPTLTPLREGRGRFLGGDAEVGAAVPPTMNFPPGFENRGNPLVPPETLWAFGLSPEKVEGPAGGVQFPSPTPPTLRGEFFFRAPDPFWPYLWTVRLNCPAEAKA